jgi:hypothetical protein
LNRDEFKEKLSAAGTQCDGHVTHGSLEAQMHVVDELTVEINNRYSRIIKEKANGKEESKETEAKRPLP